MKKFIISITIIILILASFSYYSYIYPYSGNASTITEKELNCGAYFGAYNQKKSGTPSGWVFNDVGKSSTWHALDKSMDDCPNFKKECLTILTIGYNLETRKCINNPTNCLPKNYVKYNESSGHRCNCDISDICPPSN